MTHDTLPQRPLTAQPAATHAPHAFDAPGRRPIQQRQARQRLLLDESCWAPTDPFVARRVRVSVPATSANLGPGFDCLAMALTLRNVFDVTVQGGRPPEQTRPRVTILGSPEDVSKLSRRRDNLFVAAFAALCQRQGVRMPPLTLRLRINLPPSRGLGSSATAVVGGLLAANALLGGPLNREELLELAVECEPGSHADNVAAALYGGFVVTGVRDSSRHLYTLSLPVPQGMRAALFIPDMPMSTTHGRSLLPATYTRADVSFNLGRVALLVAALQSRRLDLLATAMEDRVHQPYRATIFPALDAFIAGALAAGAHGACLSGGGSSVLALVSDDGERVRAALETVSAETGVQGRSYIAAISRHGATATLLSHEAEREGEAPLADLHIESDDHTDEGAHDE